MKPKDKKDQRLHDEFKNAHLYAVDDREARKSRKFWKRTRSKYLRQQGKKIDQD